MLSVAGVTYTDSGIRLRLEGAIPTISNRETQYVMLAP